MISQRSKKGNSGTIIFLVLACLLFWNLPDAWGQTFISGKVITSDGKVVASGVVALEKGEHERDRYLKRDVVGRDSFKRRYFLFRNRQWKLIYFAELDLLQLFNVKQDPLEKKNLIEEKPRLAAELEQQLLGYLKQVEGKTYRPLLTQSSPNADPYVKAVNR